MLLFVVEKTTTKENMLESFAVQKIYTFLEQKYQFICNIYICNFKKHSQMMLLFRTTGWPCLLLFRGQLFKASLA